MSSPHMGRVVPPDDPTSLATALGQVIAKGPVSPEDRAGIQTEAAARMSASWAASRFESLVDEAVQQGASSAGERS